MLITKLITYFNLALIVYEPCLNKKIMYMPQAAPRPPSLRMAVIPQTKNLLTLPPCDMWFIPILIVTVTMIITN